MKIYHDLEFRYYGFTDQFTTFASLIKQHCDQVGIVAQSEWGNTISTANGLDYAYRVKEVNGYFQHSLIVYNKDKKIELTDELTYKDLAIKIFSVVDCIVGTVNIFKEENHFEYEKLLAIEFLTFHLPQEGMLLMDNKRWDLYNEYPNCIRWESETKTIEQIGQDSFALVIKGWFDNLELKRGNPILKEKIWLGQNEMPGPKYTCFSIVTSSLSIGLLLEGILQVIAENEEVSFSKLIPAHWTDQEEPVSQKTYLGSLLNVMINYPESILAYRQIANYVKEIIQQNSAAILQNRSSALVSLIVNGSASLTIGDKDFLIVLENFNIDKNEYEGVYVRTIGSITGLTPEQLKFLQDIKSNLKAKAILGVSGNDCWVLSDITPKNYKEYLDKNKFIHLISAV